MEIYPLTNYVGNYRDFIHPFKFCFKFCMHAISQRKLSVPLTTNSMVCVHHLFKISKEKVKFDL